MGSLQIGQRISATVSEIQDLKYFIIEYEGMLFRVYNATALILKLNQKIELIVSEINPLKLKPVSLSGYGRLELNV